MSINPHLQAIQNLKKLDQMISDNIEFTLDRDLSEDEIERAPPNYNGKTRVWLLMLYPDCPEHVKIMEQIPKDFPQAIWAVHDMDVKETGELKKEHVHYVLYFSSAVFKTHITSKYDWYEDIDRFVRPASIIKKRVRYLLHYDDPDKFQYPIQYLEGNVKAFLKYFNGEQKETDDAQKILLLIKYSTPYDQYDLLQKVIDMNCYATYRRGYAMYNNIFREIQAEQNLQRKIY